MEAFKVDTQTPGVYREVEMGFTTFRFTDAVSRISASENVVEEVTALLRQYGEFMIIANLKFLPKSSGMSTVFALEDEESGKAIFAFWTDVKRHKLGLRFLSGVREKGHPFKHLNIDTDEWYKIVAHVYKKSFNGTDSAVALFINCEKIASLDANSVVLTDSTRNRSLRFMLGQRGRGQNSSWSNWSVSYTCYFVFSL